jgi:hypothetical protein
MEDDQNLCEICLENFNLTDKAPKFMECCPKTFCLSCLKDIYKKNGDKIACPICRKVTNKNPADLKIDKEKIEPKLICPSCHRSIKSKDLKIKISEKGTTLILCGNCSNDLDSYNLYEYLFNLTDEMDFVIKTFCSFSSEMIEGHLDFKIESFVEDLIQSFKDGLKTKIKQKILDSAEKNFKINFKNFSNISSQFEDFKAEHNKLLVLMNKDIKTYDYIQIKSSVEFYINKSDHIKQNGNNLRKIYQNVNTDEILQYDRELLGNKEDLENFFANLIKIKFKTTDNNHERNTDLKNFLTGISFIDSKINDLKKENEKLYQNYLEKDLQVKKLEAQLKSLQSNTGNLNVANIHNINHGVNNANNYNIFDDNDEIYFVASDINSFNINNSNNSNPLNHNPKKVFNYKDLFIQNFNFPYFPKKQPKKAEKHLIFDDMEKTLFDF